VDVAVTQVAASPSGSATIDPVDGWVRVDITVTYRNYGSSSVQVGYSISWMPQSRLIAYAGSEATWTLPPGSTQKSYLWIADSRDVGAGWIEVSVIAWFDTDTNPNNNEMSLPYEIKSSAPITGTLSVDTTPVKGGVYVDGNYWGVAPQSRSGLSPKSYTVSFGSVSGYNTPPAQTVQVNAGQTTTVTGTYTAITPQYGTLSVDTTPVKGEVFVNGLSWGIAPQSRRVQVGSYTVSFGAVTGYATPSTQTVSVNKDQTTTVVGMYTEIPSYVNIYRIQNYAIIKGKILELQVWKIVQINTDTIQVTFDIMNTRGANYVIDLYNGPIKSYVQTKDIEANGKTQITLNLVRGGTDSYWGWLDVNVDFEIYLIQYVWRITLPGTPSVSSLSQIRDMIKQEYFPDKPALLIPPTDFAGALINFMKTHPEKFVNIAKEIGINIVEDDVIKAAEIMLKVSLSIIVDTVESIIHIGIVLTSPAEETIILSVPAQSTSTPTIVVSMKTNQPVISAGGSCEIMLTATSGGLPLSSATVDLSTSGGYFEGSGTYSISGATDINGVYKAIWHTAPPDAYTQPLAYLFIAKVSKSGYNTVEAQALVEVTPSTSLTFLTSSTSLRFTQISGATPSSVALVSYVDELHLVVRGADNRIYYRETVGGSFIGNWRRIPGATNDAPATAVLDSRLHIVVRGTDNGIYHSYIDLVSGSWSGWTRLPGATSSSPALATSANTLHLVVRGIDNRIYYKCWTASSGWTAWQWIPGATNDVPAITILGSRLHLLVRGTDNGIYHKVMELGTGSWSSWTRLPGATVSSPTLIDSGTDRLDLVVRGVDNGIYHRVWTSGSGWSSAWERIQGATNDKPALAVYGNNLHLTVRGTDNGIYHNIMDLSSGSWSGWMRLPGATSSYPALAALTTGVEIVVRGTDNGIYYAYCS